MPTGTLKKFVIDKGFGFIQPDDGSQDVFAPVRTLSGNKELAREGLRVMYEQKPDDKTQKPMAASWRLLDGAGGAAPPGGAYGAYGGMPMQAAYGAYGGMPMGGMPMGGMAMGGYAAMPGPNGGNRFSPYGGGGPSLPPGWEQVTDPATGQPYYWNRNTNETSWSLPSGPGAASSSPAPSSSHAPEPSAGPACGGGAAAGGAPSAAGGELPEGWEQANDPSSGKPYYYNRASGQTTWEPPS